MLKAKNINRRKQQGLGFIELFILISIIAAVTASLMSFNSQTANSQQNQQWLTIAEQKLISYTALNGRLPCPDTSGNGVENCAGTVAKGGFPYITVGMTDTRFDRADNGLSYGVYIRENAANINADADLSSLLNRYEPILADAASSTYNYDNQNTVDFCIALANADAAPFSATQLFSQTPTGVNANVAFALAYSGLNDADGVNGLFDQLNGSSLTGYNTAGTARNTNYDDVVLTKSFAELAQNLKCDAVIHSLNLMATAVQSKKEVEAKAAAAKEATLVGAVKAGVTVLLLVVSAIQAAGALTAAITTLVTASGLLATAIGTCVVLVGCAFIPPYTAAVALAASGIVLAGIAVAAVVAAVISQAVATGLYIDIAIRAGAAASIDNANFADTITTMTTELATATTEQAAALARLNLVEPAANSQLTTANNRRDTITSYAVNNDDPALTATPALVTALDASRTAINNERSQHQQYDVAQAALAGVQAEISSQNIDCNATPTASSCSSLAAKQTAATNALNNWNNQKTAVSTAYQTSIDAANNYLVYDPGNPTSNPVVAPSSTPCSSIPACVLDSSSRSALGDPTRPRQLTATERQWYLSGGTSGFPPPSDATITDNGGNNIVIGQLSGSYMNYSTLQYGVDYAQSEYDQQTSAVNELTSGIAAMSCIQDGNNYNATTGVCSTPGTDPAGSEIGIAAGAEDILDTADQQGVAQ